MNARLDGIVEAIKSDILGDPGWFTDSGFTHAFADYGDFYVGPDDDGEAEALTVADVGARSEEQVASLIAAQAKAQDPTLPLSTDEVAALGLDGTGRSGGGR